MIGAYISIQENVILRALSLTEFPHSRHEFFTKRRLRALFACHELNGESRLCDGAGDPQVSGVVGHSSRHLVASWRIPGHVMFVRGRLAKAVLHGTCRSR